MSLDPDPFSSVKKSLVFINYFVGKDTNNSSKQVVRMYGVSVCVEGMLFSIDDLIIW